MSDIDELVAEKAEDMIRMHGGNALDAAKESSRWSVKYAKQKDYKNSGFWANVDRKIRHFIAGISIEP